MSESSGFDYLVHHADVELPALYQLFGGYLHQDWKLEYADWPLAIEAFRQDAPPHLREGAIIEIAQLVEAEFSEEELATLLYPSLDCNFLPPARGLSNKEWLLQVAELLKKSD